MHTALRPFMTTGIAIVGAGVLVAAPLTVPPPTLPAVEVAAPAAVARTVTADVELTALIDALLVAIPEAVVGTAQFLFQTVPTVILNDIAMGRFGHAIAIALIAPAAAFSMPWAPIVGAFANELPLPLGTFDGVLNQGLYLANALPSIPIQLITLAGAVLDGELALADFPAAALDAINTRLDQFVESFQKIVAAITGTLPFSPFTLQQEMQSFVVEDEAPAPEIEAFAPNPADATQDASATTVSLSVETSTPDDVDEAMDGTDEELDEQSTDPPDEDETPNGGTDLTDGNMAQPGDAGDEESAGDDADSDTTTVTDPGHAVTGEDPVDSTDEPADGTGDESNDDGGESQA